MSEYGPIYGTPLIQTLPLGQSGGMIQQMPSRDDLRGVPERVAAGYEVALSHLLNKSIRVAELESQNGRLESEIAKLKKQIDSEPSPFREPFTNPRSGMGVKDTPVESPDDWVTQDRVAERPGIDQWRWLNKTGSKVTVWLPTIPQHALFMHGHKTPRGCVVEVRCRRKDLPELPTKTTRTVTFRRWIGWDTIGKEYQINYIDGMYPDYGLLSNWHDTGETVSYEVPMERVEVNNATS